MGKRYNLYINKCQVLKTFYLHYIQIQYVHVYVQQLIFMSIFFISKWKQIQIIITIFDWNQNLIGYDFSLFVLRAVVAMVVVVGFTTTYAISTYHH
jgi:hypothetical protein